MGRSPCCSKEGLNRGAWTAVEDRILVSYIKTHGEGKWRSLPTRAGLKRCGKSCRLRWLNYLRPDIKRGNISDEEEELIVRLHRLLGNRWSLIAGRLPGRTDNEIKNYWNTTLGKKVQQQAADASPGKRRSAAPPHHKPPKGKKPVIGESCTSSPTANSNPVIRTKASKCTKQLPFLSPASGPPAGGPTDHTSPPGAAPDTAQDQIFPRHGAADGKAELSLDGSAGDMMLFDEALLESWFGGNEPLDMAADLQSLASFLESDDWIDDDGGACSKFS